MRLARNLLTFCCMQTLSKARLTFCAVLSAACQSASNWAGSIGPSPAEARVTALREHCAAGGRGAPSCRAEPERAFLVLSPQLARARAAAAGAGAGLVAAADPCSANIAAERAAVREVPCTQLSLSPYFARTDLSVRQESDGDVVRD